MTIVCDDVVHWAETTPPIGAHAMLTDAPYSLGDGKSGFMGKKWDTDVAFRPDTWRALAAHLLPGAFGMCFGSSRGWHRLACAIEDAGLILHPSVFMLGWATSQGFPKATRIDTQVDAHGGQNLGWFGPWLRQWREAKGVSQKALAQHFPSRNGGLTGCVANWELGLNMPTVEQYNMLVQALSLPFPSLEAAERAIVGQRMTGLGTGNGSVPLMGDGCRDLTTPATDLAHTWAGHRYGGQVLKPALEPIIVFQVPYHGRPVDSITATGAGALWIEGSRLPTGNEAPRGTGNRDSYRQLEGRTDRLPEHGGNVTPASGRWPPNLALVHLSTCQPLGPQQVQGRTGGAQSVRGAGGAWAGAPGLFTPGRSQAVHHYTAPDGTEVVQAWACSPGCAVATFDRQAGELGSGGARSASQDDSNRSIYGNLSHNPGSPGHDAGPASRFMMTADWALDVAEQLARADPVFYAAKASREERDEGLYGMPMQESTRYGEMTTQGPLPQQTPRRPTQQRNGHPTIKPISLCTWLARLLLPPAAYAPRRLLVPFCGTGSEIIGATLAGWENIVGIEQDAATVALAEQRVRWWTTQIAAQLSLGW